jgi:SAM-dependent methyltransferase/uncharacterized protein YbaR (Trm112 family)
MKAALQDTICPVCRHPLQALADSFYCSQCARSYPIINGIPILLKKDHAIVHETVEQKSVSGMRQWFRQILQKKPEPQFSTATQANVQFLCGYLSPDSKLLFVGGGITSYGRHMEQLGKSVLSHCVNLEVAGGPFVDLVADGHDIPFPDNYFDAIICQAVLEHTRDTQRVVSEMHRVLKPDGILYVEVPFLYPVHMHSDFRRFTLMGIQELFSDFDSLREGVNGAVASAFVVISVNFFSTLFSFGNKSLYQAGRFVFSWLFVPIKYLDGIFCKYSTAPVSASGLYFMGRKRALRT